MLIDAHHTINENTTLAFKSISDLLAPPQRCSGIFFDSYNKVIRYEFLFTALGRAVTVIWSENGDAYYSERIPEGAVVYDTLGQQLPVVDNHVTLTGRQPVFVVR